MPSITSFGREKGYPKSSRKYADKRITTTHKDRFNIHVDSADLFGEALLDQLPFQIGDLFAYGSTCLIGMETERHESNRLIHYLDLTYEPLSDEDKEDANKPPDQRKPKWHWGFETIERACAFDVETGIRIANSVGEPIELVSPWSIPVLYIDRWQHTFDEDVILEYVNHVNENAFWGAAAKAVLMGGITDNEDSAEVYAGHKYRKVSYVLKFMLPLVADVIEGWKELVIDNGTFYFDANGLAQHFRDDHGNLTTGNLDGTGHAAPFAGQHVLKWNKLATADFGNLNLGPFH